MAHKRRKLDKLVFPDQNTWVSDWLTHAILATPKWQINAVLGSFYFNEWIDYLASGLDGLRLPAKVNPLTNWQRSMAVGIGVAIASEQYENNKIKVEMATQNQFLKDVLSAPTVKLALGQSTLSPVAKTTGTISPEGATKMVATQVA